VRVPARTECAVRAALTLAAAEPATAKGRGCSHTQLQGQAGGYALTRAAATITVGQVLRRLDREPGAPYLDTSTSLCQITG
jgi:hypothetical protein